uniref:Uncharacterized protein LOC107643478 n=1 Tax=Rhizophora mucronata TaxID=61149 RepID=A0A2P2N7Q9_RHIMU
MKTAHPYLLVMTGPLNANSKYSIFSNVITSFQETLSTSQAHSASFLKMQRCL